MRVVFFGSGIIASTALSELICSHDVLIVFTTERFLDRTRKQKENYLISTATDSAVPVRSVQQITLELIEEVRLLDPDIICVVSFGLFLPKSLLSVGNFVPLNIHPSNVPRWRGAAPIARAIESGESVITVSIIEVTNKMDAGDIFATEEIVLSPKMNSSDVYPIVGSLGGSMLSRVMFQLVDGVASRSKQDESLVTFAPKITPKEMVLDFSCSALIVVNKIRAFDIFGGCYFYLRGKKIKILCASMIDSGFLLPDRSLIDVSGGQIDIMTGIVYCSDGAFQTEVLQRDGGKILSAKDFWNGYRNSW